MFIKCEVGKAIHTVLYLRIQASTDHIYVSGI